MRALNNLGFSSKVTILSIIFLLPLGVLLWFFIVEKSASITSTQREIAAVRSLKQIHIELGGLDVGEITGSSNHVASDHLIAAQALAHKIEQTDAAGGLSLDPDNNTYYLIETAAVQLPGLAIRDLELRQALISSQLARAAPTPWVSLALDAGKIEQVTYRISDRLLIASRSITDQSTVDQLTAIRGQLSIADRLLTLAVSQGDRESAERALDQLDMLYRLITPAIDNQIVVLLSQRIQHDHAVLDQRLGTVFVLVFLGGLFALGTAISITKPVRAMTRLITHLAEGNLSVAIGVEDRRDEIGTMSNALTVLRDRLIEGNWARQQRNEAVEALEQGQGAFQLPFAANPLPMWIYDRETFAFLEVNDAAVEEYGWSREQFLGMSILDVIIDEEKERVRQLVLTRQKDRRVSGPWTHVVANGQRIRVQMFSRTMNFLGRQAALNTAVDVTNLLNLEEQLLQARKMEAVGLLAGGIAHDFNNILGGILGYAGFLVEDLPAGSTEREFAARILAGGERARDLVKQILAFSRVESVEKKPTNLAAILGETRDLLKSSFPSSTKLSIDANANDLIAVVNPTQVSQIVINLCINANDALKGEPGRIAVALTRIASIEAEVSPPVDLDFVGESGNPPENSIQVGSFDPSRRYARLTVSDTGIGMTNEQLSRIFEPFFTTKSRGHGTGLGLSIVHNILSGYNGVCIVRSRQNYGSTFQIYLPLSEEFVDTPEVVKPRVAGGEAILVVDDETMITDMLKTGLGRLGYAVTTVNDPRVALEWYRDRPKDWDVVISDQVMPEMRGTALFHELRNINPELRFILCTGFSDESTKTTSLAAGIDAFFHKPVSPQTLAETIRYLLDRVSTQGDFSQL